MSKHNLNLGAWGEKLAMEFLIEKGYAVVGRNIRTPHGEIDLLVEKDGEMVFVEVKTRSNATFGAPEESITTQKKDHMIACVEYYLQNLEKILLPGASMWFPFWAGWGTRMWR